jgi:hypothetical protein
MSNFGIAAVDVEELERSVAGVFELNASLVGKPKEISPQRMNSIDGRVGARRRSFRCSCSSFG